MQCLGTEVVPELGPVLCPKFKMSIEFHPRASSAVTRNPNEIIVETGKEDEEEETTPETIRHSSISSDLFRDAISTSISINS